MVSTLFTECQNSTPFRRYDQFNFRGFDFYIGKRGVIFGDFFTIFAYKIFNIDVENTKIVTKMQTMDIITKKILKLKIFENFGQNWANFDKKCHFLQKCDLFKITFCVITWPRMKLETWNLVSVCRKKLQKTYKERNFEFLIFSLFIVILVIFFVKKTNKIQ